MKLKTVFRRRQLDPSRDSTCEVQMTFRRYMSPFLSLIAFCFTTTRRGIPTPSLARDFTALADIFYRRSYLSVRVTHRRAIISRSCAALRRNGTQDPMRRLADYREAVQHRARFTHLTRRALSLIANLVNERRHWMRLSNWRGVRRRNTPSCLGIDSPPAA